MLRAEVKKESVLGKRIKQIIDSGKLVSDDIINELMKQYAGDKIIYDGYPRTIGQAEFMESFVKKPLIIYFDVNGDVVVKRLGGRFICPKCGYIYNTESIPPQKKGICDLDGSKLIQREDDKPESVRKRFKEYQEKTKPLVEFYNKKKLLKTIDASKLQDEEYVQVKKLIK